MTEPLIDLNELIGKLPESMQGLAQDAVPVLIDMSQDDLLGWIANAVEGDYETAYAAYLSRLTIGEQLAEGERLNARIADAHQGNYDRRKYVQDMVKAVASVGLIYLRARAIGV